jgi:hypothetical protein
MSLPILVQYNIPRYVIGKPGKQNHACTGEMTIMPGLAVPFEFIYSNNDGVPINLTDFTLRLVFWFPQQNYELLPANLNTNVVLVKDLIIEDPYTGTAGVLLDDQETLTIGAGGRGSLRWSIYMIDTLSGNTFGTQITAIGGLYGICHIERTDMPNAETIKGSTVSPTVPA